MKTEKVETPIGQAILFLRYDKGDPTQQMLAQIMGRIDAMWRPDAAPSKAVPPEDKLLKQVRSICQKWAYEMKTPLSDEAIANAYFVVTRLLSDGRTMSSQETEETVLRLIDPPPPPPNWERVRENISKREKAV